MTGETNLPVSSYTSAPLNNSNYIGKIAEHIQQRWFMPSVTPPNFSSLQLSDTEGNIVFVKFRDPSADQRILEIAHLDAAITQPVY